jgi:hypothetical protein
MVVGNGGLSTSIKCKLTRIETKLFYINGGKKGKTKQRWAFSSHNRSMA